MKKQKHYHIVHQSLILDATVAGVKSSWFGYLCLAGLILFPFSGGSFLGIAALVAMLWGVLNFGLVPIYDYDDLVIELFTSSVFWQEEFYQNHADINAPRPVDNTSIPNINF